MESSVIRVADEYIVFRYEYTTRVTKYIFVSNVTLERSIHRKYSHAMSFVVANIDFWVWKEKKTETDLMLVLGE